MDDEWMEVQEVLQIAYSSRNFFCCLKKGMGQIDDLS